MDVVYGAGDVLAAMMILKQRWDMGLKDMKVGTSGGLLDPSMYIGVSGYDASQGFISQHAAPWNYKKTKVNPEYVEMCRKVMEIVSEKQGKPFTYTAWTDWIPAHLQILSQAMMKAGSVDDPDKIMDAIRGRDLRYDGGEIQRCRQTFYGSPIVFGTAGALSVIQGEKEVYFSESPWKPVP